MLEYHFAMEDPTIDEFRVALKAMTTQELGELSRRMKTKTALLLEELIVLQEHTARRNAGLPKLFTACTRHAPRTSDLAPTTWSTGSKPLVDDAMDRTSFNIVAVGFEMSDETILAREDAIALRTSI